MVVLLEMSEAEFTRWRETSIREYAADLTKAGYRDDEPSTENQAKEFDALLPEGRSTEGQYLFSIVDEQNDDQPVGIIWYGEIRGRSKDTMWIYDIRVDEPFRGHGYGSAALKIAEKRARDLGKKKMGLQVFAHNQRAWKLCDRLGYKPTSVMMAREL